jgi:hypothetical protein
MLGGMVSRRSEKSLEYANDFLTATTELSSIRDRSESCLNIDLEER